MARILRLSGLAPVVTGTRTTEPTTGADEWRTLADKALVTIIANCEEEGQILIEGCDTPAEAWGLLKEHYDGRARMHLSALLLNIVHLRYDGRNTSISEHIMTFENKWNLLCQNTASATAGTNSLAAGIKNFSNTDSCKATMLLATLPKIQIYQNIIYSITGTTEEPAYSKVVLRLGELSERAHSRQPKSATEAPSAFTSTTMFCGYCKKRGFPETSHNEVDCRAKKRNKNKKLQTAHATTTKEPAEVDEWLAMSFMTTTTSPQVDDTHWWIDSSSTVHITHSLADLSNPQPHRQAVKTGGGVVHSTHKGSIFIHGTRLSNCLFVPTFPKKLLSMSTLASLGWNLFLCKSHGELEKEGVRVPLVEEGSIYRLRTEEVHLVTDMEWQER